ncbi:hypothetical protein AX17_006211 [Amanita inopinata Kibby_2008]|nr:hypothetical protein AX17_006211 [Amanita inopinata Kibby_2008]
MRFSKAKGSAASSARLNTTKQGIAASSSAITSMKASASTSDASAKLSIISPFNKTDRLSALSSTSTSTTKINLSIPQTLENAPAHITTNGTPDDAIVNMTDNDGSKYVSSNNIYAHIPRSIFATA